MCHTVKENCAAASTEQTHSHGLGGVDGSFTYFTTCIEGRVGRVNDNVALHVGNVCLDNLQLQTTTTKTTTTGKQHGDKHTVSVTTWDRGEMTRQGEKRREEERRGEHAPRTRQEAGLHLQPGSV